MRYIIENSGRPEFWRDTSKKIEKEEERRSWRIEALSDARESLPLRPVLREAYEQGRWQAMVNSRLHEQSRKLQAVLDHLKQKRQAQPEPQLITPGFKSMRPELKRLGFENPVHYHFPT